MANHTHFFFALELPAETKERLEEAVKNLRKQMPFHSWVHPMDTHITLAFLGNAESAKLEAADLRIAGVLDDFPSFNLEINHLGVFGNKEVPRIFWAGLKESATLQEARERVYQACSSAGFTLEKRPFSPHITIARKWTGEQAFTYDLLEEHNPFSKEAISFKAERVVLYKTNLGNIPKYEPINIFQLGAR